MLADYNGREEEIVELLHSFDKLRNARNRINHAAELDISLDDEIGKAKLILNELLDRLSNFK